MAERKERYYMGFRGYSCPRCGKFDGLNLTGSCLTTCTHCKREWEREANRERRKKEWEEKRQEERNRAAEEKARRRNERGDRGAGQSSSSSSGSNDYSNSPSSSSSPSYSGYSGGCGDSDELLGAFWHYFVVPAIGTGLIVVLAVMIYGLCNTRAEAAQTSRHESATGTQAVPEACSAQPKEQVVRTTRAENVNRQQSHVTANAPAPEFYCSHQRAGYYNGRIELLQYDANSCTRCNGHGSPDYRAEAAQTSRHESATGMQAVPEACSAQPEVQVVRTTRAENVNRQQSHVTANAPAPEFYCSHQRAGYYNGRIELLQYDANSCTRCNGHGSPDYK